MLENTRAASYVPGSNLRPSSAGAAWLFLLPRLGLGRIVCLGPVPGPTLEALCRVGREVVVVCSGARALARVNAQLRRRGRANARAISSSDRSTIPEGSADLVVVPSARLARSLRADHRWPDIARLLRTDGVVYLESRRSLERADAVIGGDGWLVTAGRERFAITPALGEVRAAVPADDRRTVTAFRRRGLWSADAFVGFRGRVREVPLGPAPRLLGPRWAVLAGLGVSGWLGRPPLYLREIAREAGISLDRYRWGMAAPGLYLSNKVLFLLYEETGDEHPAYVVKVTRDPGLNGRLENEWRALQALHERGLAETDAVPRPAFFGTSGSLAVLGVTGIPGRPFTDHAPAPDSPLAAAATDWITELGAATADPEAGGPANAAAELRALRERFTEIYSLEGRHRDVLDGHIETIAGSGAPFPAVFQHGDPGAWNLLVTPAGRVAFLDWESAETRGMPLWDLFHFMRSYGVLVARAGGTSDALRGFTEQFLADTPANARLTEATSRYCARLDLSPSFVEPLFYTCWMHRALKESTRLPPDRLDRGHYLNLLRRCLDARDEAPLRRLFALDAHARR